MRINKFSLMSLEAIDHQMNDPLVSTLENAFTLYKEEKINNAELSKLIDTAVKKRCGFNLTTNIVLSFEANANYEVVMIDINHPLTRKSLEHFSQDALDDGLTEATKENVMKLAKGTYNSKGVLNLKEAKVSGAFAEIPVTINLYTALLNKLEPIECVAVFLHELGHAWTFFEFLGIYTYRNALLANTTKEYLECKSVEEKRKFILKTNNAYGISVPKELAETNDDDAVQVLLGVTGKRLYNGVTSMMYDNTSVEAIADQFAVRFGVGKELTLALSKFANSWRMITIHTFTYLGIALYWAIASITTLLGVATTIATAPFMTIMSIIVFPLVALGSFDIANNFVKFANGASTYDTPQRRLMRIRNEMVSRLKATRNKGNIESIIKQLDEVKDYIEKADNYNNIFVKIYRFISSDFKSEEEKKIYQQITEDLVNNSLYVSSAKFKQLAN